MRKSGTCGNTSHAIAETCCDVLGGEHRKKARMWLMTIEKGMVPEMRLCDKEPAQERHRERAGMESPSGLTLIMTRFHSVCSTAFWHSGN